MIKMMNRCHLFLIGYNYKVLLGCEQAWTPSFYLRSFDMDSVQVGKAVFVKESYTTLGIEPRTYSYPGRSVNHPSVCWV